MGSNRIVKMLCAPEREEMTRDLRSVDLLIKAGAPLTPESRLTVGQRVRVKNGALMGLEGIILSRRGEDRLLVAVRFLQQGASIQIQDFQLEVV